MSEKPDRLNKSVALEYWSTLNQSDPAEKMKYIPYKTPGSKFGFDGIRIDGTREFIDSVLSNLKTIIKLENGNTRLELNYTETVNKETGMPMGSWVCYIRLHERGTEGKILQSYMRG